MSESAQPAPEPPAPTRPRHGTPVARPYRPGDEAAIVRLFTATFGDRSHEQWEWRFTRGPVPAFILVVELDGRIVTHAGWNIHPTWIRGQRGVTSSGSDFMTDPEARGRGVTSATWVPAIEFYASMAASLDFPNEESAALVRRRGWPVTFMGELPQWVRWHSGSAVAASRPGTPKPVGAAVAAGSRLAGRRWPSRLVVGPLTDPGADVDELAERSAAFAPCIRIRDAAFVRWRWLDHPGGAWSVAGARDRSGRLEGYIAWTLTDEGIGRIGDLLAADRRAATALVRHAADDLDRRGATLTTCELLDPRSWSRRAMWRAGFVPRGTGPTLMLSHVDQAQRHVVGQRTSWYVTLADSDLT